MKKRLKQLGKNFLVYGSGGIIPKGIGFFLLPVYTRICSAADYGTIEIMGMDSAQSFYFFEQKREGQKAQARVVTTILQWRITWGSGIVLLSTLISQVLNKYLLNGQSSWEYFDI